MKNVLLVFSLILCTGLFSACNDSYRKGIVIRKTALADLDSVERYNADWLLEDDCYMDIKLANGKIVHAAGVPGIDIPGKEVKVRQDGDLLFIGH